jgi:3-oxoacyl-[acyl-carrier-protein] synthase II
MTKQREVVITGTGVVSPIGIGKHAYWQSLEQGTSGIARIRHFDPSKLEIDIGGEIKGFQAKEYVTPRKSLKVMCREVQMFYCDPPDMAEAFAAAVNEHAEFEMERWGRQGMNRLYPLWLLMFLPNMAACHVAIPFDARGPNNTVTIGEASSLTALIEAVRVIERGHADVMITGGTGSRINITSLVNRATSPLSRRCDDPAAACRPFEANRDGSVNGEGAAAFVLETRQHAESRGATILASIRGCGQAFGSGSDHQRRVAGIARAMRMALEEAKLTPQQIGHVNAHGMATVADDRSEAAAIREVLGDVPVTALKSYFGNLGAGGGAVELVGSLLAFAHDKVPRTLNYEQPDPECPVQVVADQPLPDRTRTAMALNHSSMGQCTAVVLAAE